MIPPTPEEFEDLKRRLDLVEAAIEQYEEQADPSREAARVLGDLAVQAGLRITSLENLARSIEDTRSEVRAMLGKVDSLATVELVEAVTATVVASVRESFVASQKDQASKRRVSAIRLGLAGVWLMLAFGWVLNERVERCSPGAKTEPIVEVILGDGPTLERLRAAARLPRPILCDITGPIHAHTRGSTYPTVGNLIGWAVLAAGAAGTGYAVRRRDFERGSIEDNAILVDEQAIADVVADVAARNADDKPQYHDERTNP